ncbi:MAG: ABC transporter ATP-binding protein [Chloroflexota bacterium]|nr:MAG: ABC transporter ATP-binding protein [Chloroflexota bacterium]
MPVLLQVKDLRTSLFTQVGEVKAVDGVSFDIDSGEALGVVGESGCGKSVTALSIMRLVPNPPGHIVGGQMVFDRRDLLKLSDQEMRRVRGKDIAMIFQDPMTSLNPVLTIRRQITESLQLHMGMNAGQARERAIELLKMVGIPSPKQRINDYPHQFSGGMRQRVMIAIALACSPRLIIADEPTTALDVTIQAQIVDLVKHLRRELGTAVMWITHDLGIVAGLCDRVVVMYAGHIVESAPVRELYANPSHPYTLGLLRSIPRLDQERRTKLVPIDGFPPDLIDLPAVCAFRTRCAHIGDACQEGVPPLRLVGPDHYVACWVDVKARTPALSA